MCKKLTLDIQEAFKILHDGDKQRIKEMLTRLYAEYNKYSKSTQYVIDNIFNLAMELL